MIRFFRSPIFIGTWLLLATGCGPGASDKIAMKPAPSSMPSPSMSATPVMTASGYAAAGEASCRRGNYEEAVPPLRRALEMAKEESTLSKEAWQSLSLI